MALYLIGDLQGCNAALGRLLDRIDFSPSRDTACFVGDLVNRGPDSLGVLQRLMALGDAARCILGNHDLHLLAVAHGIRAPHSGDTLEPILNSPQRESLLAWLRAQPGQQALALRAVQNRLQRIAAVRCPDAVGDCEQVQVMVTQNAAGRIAQRHQALQNPQRIRPSVDQVTDKAGGIARGGEIDAIQ